MDKYKNKYFSLLGDSISTFEGVSIPEHASYYDTGRKLSSGVTTVSSTWWGIVLDALKARLLVNNSVSGSTVVWHPSYEIESYGCSDGRTGALSKDGVTPDVIMVYLGTNDWGAGIKLADDNNPQDFSVFCNAYRQMLEKIIANYPNAEIWCFTLATGYCSQRKDFVFPFYCGRWHIAEYCEIIRKLSKEYGCKLIELFKNTSSYDTIDGFHPNKDGMSTIANRVLENLR